MGAVGRISRLPFALGALLALAACAQPVSSPPPSVSGPTAPATTVVPAPTTPDDPCAAVIDAELAGRTLEERIALTLMLYPGPNGELEPRWGTRVGGLFLSSPDQVPAIEALPESGWRPIVAVDDEGGRVRWIDDEPSTLPAPLDLAVLPEADIRTITAARGRVLADLGVDLTLAPVIDLYPGSRGGVIGDRAFSDDPAEIARLAAVYAAGFADAGIATTLKHFPGHGLADGDSHLALPRTPSLAELERRDLIPFRELIAADPDGWVVMMGHLDVPGLTSPGTPATVDPSAYLYLRRTLGHEGLIVTDELTGMAAVSDSLDATAAAIQALTAGADLLLLAQPGDVGALIDAVADAVRSGQLDESRIDDAASRVLRAKSCGT